VKIGGKKLLFHLKSVSSDNEYFPLHKDSSTQQESDISSDSKMGAMQLKSLTQCNSAF
jgi:hypothetical protein